MPTFSSEIRNGSFARRIFKVAYGNRFQRKLHRAYSKAKQITGDILAWLEIFGQLFTKAVPEYERGTFLEEIRNEVSKTPRDSER